MLQIGGDSRGQKDKKQGSKQVKLVFIFHVEECLPINTYVPIHALCLQWLKDVMGCRGVVIAGSYDPLHGC